MCFFMGVKGAGGGGGLDVWGVPSRALMMWLVIWLKHCFGVCDFRWLLCDDGVM